MIISKEERRSNSPLIVFIDLLFLLVAFFTLLLFFIQQERTISEANLERVQEMVAEVTGQQVDVREAVRQLEPIMERVMERREAQAEAERERAARAARREQRETVRLRYRITPEGAILHEGQRYTLQGFREQVVAPLRQDNWVAFRAYASPETPFGTVIESRAVLLREANEFDTYWDNVTREEASGGN